VPGYEGFQRPPTFADIAALGLDLPLVYLLSTTAGGAALVLRPGAGPRVTHVDLPELADRALAARLRRYLDAYKRRHTDDHQWRRVLNDVTRWLWEAAMGPVTAALRGERQAALVPTGALGLLPLHAAWATDPRRPTGRRYILDEVALTFVPNARALRAATGVATAVEPESLLVIADPAPSRRPPLRYAPIETAGACDSFAGRHEQLVGDRATKAAVGRSMSRFPVVHFACHGSTNVAQPLESALHLSSDETLAAREIMALRLAGLRLAVLSACETAVPDLELLDEVVSLPTALLQARVGGVIATLWSVDDESAMVLMLRFYELWRGEGLHPREALREAQRWVRDSTLADKCDRFPQAPDLVAASTLTNSSREWALAHRAHRDPSQWAAFVYVGA
jgi:CHAT domain-containing protein